MKEKFYTSKILSLNTSWQKKNKNKMDQPHLGSWIQSHLKLYLIHKTISELKCFLVLLEEIKFLNSLSREMKTVAGDRVVAL